MKILVPLCCAGMLLAGCSSSPRVQYYSLHNAVPPKSAGNSYPDVTLSIGPVSLPDIFNKSKIATGGAGGVYDISEYHRWAGSVDQDIAMALAEYLSVELGTERVGLYPTEKYLNPDYQLIIDILALEGSLGKEAILTVRWTVLEPENITASVIRRSHLTTQPVGVGYDSWVQAQQDNLHRLGVEISAVIKEQINK